MLQGLLFTLTLGERSLNDFIIQVDQIRTVASLERSLVGYDFDHSRFDHQGLQLLFVKLVPLGVALSREIFDSSGVKF